MLSNKIILLNAPKGAGKDTIGLALQNLYNCELRAFKTKLYEIAYSFTSGIGYSEFIYYCTDRESKEIRSSKFRGKSPRDFLIFISEQIVKPNFSKEFFGKAASETISGIDFQNGVVFTDSGFIEEALPLIKDFGGRNVFIIQFTGQNSNDFSGDSREFIETDKCHVIKMNQTNDNMSPKEYAMLIAQEILKYG